MGVIGLLDHAFGHLIVEAEVEDGIHHAGHRSTCTASYADEQRVLGVAEFTVHQAFDVFHSGHHLVMEQLHDLLLTYLIIFITGVCSDRKSRWYRNSQKIHLSKVGSFASQPLTHLCISFGFTIAEKVNSFFTHSRLEIILLVFI